MRVTLRDVARQAGVSIKTVSRVVNGQADVAEETQRRVKAAIDQLGYHPNRIAQGLVTNRTRTIGLILADITNPYFAEVALSIQEHVRAQDYNMFLYNSRGDPKEEMNALRSLAMHGVDGIILFPTHQSERNLAQFAPTYQTLVLVDHEHPGASAVLVELYRGARLAAEHLIEQGRRTIGMLSEPIVSSQRGKRLRGFSETLRAHGLPADQIAYAPPTTEGGREGALRLLQQMPSITAIFAQNDLMALGALNACRQMGLKTPDDCAVVGFDDIQFASVISPALTTVRIDRRALGRMAADRLMAMMKEPGQVWPPLKLDVELVVRQSA
jgi:LacI family transcriptional regulator